MAVCQYKPRTTAEMSYVALVPQREELNSCGGGQARPPGFHVIYLPYLDDLRQLPRTAVGGEASQEAVEAAKEVINKLKLRKFQPVENVALQSHYRMIEAHALKKTTLTPPEDETVPDLERMTRKLGKRSLDFLQEVYEEGYNPEVGPAKKPGRSTSGAQSQAATQGPGEEIDMEGQVRAGTLAKLTVGTLHPKPCHPSDLRR